MAKDLTEPTIGSIVMPITWDGTNFHVLLSTVAGLLEVAVPGPVVCNMMGWNVGGPAWEPVQVDGAGQLQVDIAGIASGEIRTYAYDGGMWRWITCDVAGHLQVDLVTIPDGQIKGYLWDGAAWQKVKGLASGIAQVDIDSLRGHNDIIPYHLYAPFVESQTKVTVGANDSVYGTAVPAGIVRVYTAISYTCVAAAGTMWNLDQQIGVNWRALHNTITPIANQYIVWNGELFVAAGGQLRAHFVGVAAGNTVFINLWGHDMRIP